MRESEKDAIHQFDIWHFYTSIKKNLVAATKKKPCQALNGWIKSIINHLWWAVSTCDGDEILLREKWCSILFHIQNKHKRSSCAKFHKCVHPRTTKSKGRKKLWLNPTSNSFKALQLVAMDKHVLGDLKYLTKFSHTGILEIFYALNNKWIPNIQHFSHLGMITRSHLAVMDFNSGSNLSQAKTKGGQGKYNFGYSKITKQWSSKAIKVKKEKAHYF